MKKVAIQLGAHIVHHRAAASGKKPPIVLVHGLGVSGDYYIPFAKQLADHYDTYIIDLPGYGTTPKPYPPLNIAELSDIVLDYIKEMELREVTIIGQSMGCQIIAHAAAKQPLLFSKMILLAPTVNKNERRLSMQVYRLLQDTFHEPINATLLVIRDYVRMGIRRYLISSRYMIADHIEQTLTSCLQPALIIRGKKDKIVPHAWALHLSQISPRYTLAELSSAPHLLHYKKPQELVDICRRFIEK